MPPFSWPFSGTTTPAGAPAPTTPDYGVDWYWNGDIDPTGRLVNGPLAVAQAIARRLITTRGTLFYDPEYGFNLRDFLNETVEEGQTIFQIESGIETECLKDERVESADAAAEYIESASRLRVTARLVLAEGPFELVLIVDAVTLEILSLQSAA